MTNCQGLQGLSCKKICFGYLLAFARALTGVEATLISMRPEMDAEITSKRDDPVLHLELPSIALFQRTFECGCEKLLL